MFQMSPEQMHRQVVRSQEQARRQVSLERQAVKAHATGAAGTSSRDTLRTVAATVRRTVEAFRPHSVRPAPVR